MTDELCPHHAVIAADPERFERGYYASGREREDLIFAITKLKEEVASYREGFLNLEAVAHNLAQDRAQWRERAQRWKEAARWYREVARR